MRSLFPGAPPKGCSPLAAVRTPSTTKAGVGGRTREVSFRLLVVSCLVALPAFAQGMLIPTDTSMGPLGVKYQRVSAEIQDGTAVTKVEQVFVNSGPQQLEAHFVFPLPKGAALQEFYLWINGKKTKGEILEKQKATDIYEGIVRRLKDPGLLEYVDSDVFRARVFPYLPMGSSASSSRSARCSTFRAASTTTITRWERGAAAPPRCS